MTTSTEKRIRPLTVRVYFYEDMIRCNTEFAMCGNGDVTHKATGIKLKYENGRFFFDTFNGEVPAILTAYTSTVYSLFDCGVKAGYRPKGQYRDQRFPKAEAEVSSCSPHIKKTDTYTVKIWSGSLDDLIGLYDAILAGELVPVSYGKPAHQIIEELQAKLEEAEKDIKGFEQLTLHHEDKLNDLQDKIADLSATILRQTQILNERDAELAFAKSPWHKKLLGLFSRK